MGEIQSLFIAGIIFSAVIIGVGTWYGTLASNYGVQVQDYTFLNRSIQFQNKISGVRQQLNSSDPSSLSSFNPVQGFSAMQQAGQGVDLLGGIVDDVTNAQPIIPPWVGVMIIGILGVVVAFGLIKGLLKIDA